MSKILITEKVDCCGTDFLKSKGHEIVQFAGRDPILLEQSLRDCEGVLVRTYPITRKMMEGSKLKVIAAHGIGVDFIDVQAAKELGIAVTTVPGGNSLSVAEHTVALIMACAKMLPALAEGYRTVGYDVKNDIKTVEITGKTLGLVGFGRIGSMVAKMCRCGFDMKVLAFDPFIKTPPEGVTIVTDRNQIFRDSDYICIHSPLTPETRHSIGAAEFAMMKPSAVLINCARGPIIDEKALITALQQGKIGGAGLDVTDPEPADPANPLFAMANVIITPHNAASAQQALERVSMGAAVSIEAVLQGQEVIGRVV